MNCPVCKISLLISERQGIEIDYCQQCRGVWLDRGELDKLIERAGSTKTDSTTKNLNYKNSDSDWDDDQKTGIFGGTGTFPGQRRRDRENPIGELFDFF